MTTDFEWHEVPAPDGGVAHVGMFSGVRAIVSGCAWAVGRGQAGRSGRSTSHEQAKHNACAAAVDISMFDRGPFASPLLNWAWSKGSEIGRQSCDQDLRLRDGLRCVARIISRKDDG